MISVTRRTAIAGGLAATLAPDAFAQAAGAQAPLSLNEYGHVIVPVTINGAAALGLVDNGFSATAMDLAFARSKSLVSGEVARVNGADAERSIRVKLAMGPVTAMVNPPLIDMSEIPSGQQTGIAAILGRDCLSEIIATFDFDAGQLTCSNPRRFKPPEGARRLAVASGPGGALQMTVKAEGQTLHAHVDLGCSTPLMVRESQLARRWLDDGRRWTTGALSTARGGEMALDECRVTRLASMTAAGAELARLPVAIYPASHPVFGRFEAVIGAPALGRFLVVLDVRGSRLWLKPGARAADPFRASLVGLGVQLEAETLVVVHVARGGPAEAAGLKPGDVIVQIYGGPPRRSLLRDAKAGDRLEIGLAGGARRSLTAASYY
jgi:predicted aspartyl protease